MQIKYVTFPYLLGKYGFLTHEQEYNCQLQEFIYAKISLLFNSKIYNEFERNTLCCKNEDSNFHQFKLCFVDYI
jgi:hypothetical protein